MSDDARTGAQSLVQAFVDEDVNVCFANPGTSEMHFVAALDSNPEMQCVLGLFEGVVTGAADGYARMAGKPAVTLTHLGPGLANGLANVHNAKKARTPMVNVVGDHATYHRKFDAPLTSDVEGVARPMSHWVKVSSSADDVATDGLEAVQAASAHPGQIATLILPADTAWNETTATPKKPSALPEPTFDDAQVRACADAIRSGERCVILMNGVLSEERLALADRIAQCGDVQVLTDTFIPRMRRGAGVAPAMRLPYFGEQAAEVLAGTRHLILVSSQPPVTFFAYPDKPNVLTPEGCSEHELVARDGDVDGALQALADELDAPQDFRSLELARPDVPNGALTPENLGLALANQFPENAIIVDEGGVSGFGVAQATLTAPPHDYLMLTGGSIGYGLPCATGAAVACRDQRVICVQADGSGMYTNQALWTMAREGLNVTTIILANQKYAILQIEFARVGAHNPGPKAMSMLDLGNPEIHWANMAQSMGMAAWRVDTVDAFSRALAESLATPGPSLIEALI